MTTEDKLLTVAEVAQRLRISKRLAYDLVGKDIPATRIGRSRNAGIRVLESDLEAWIAERRQA